VSSIPRVAAALVAQMPAVAVSLVTGLVQGIPKIVSGFASEMLKIPAEFGKALLDAINPFSGGGILGGVPIVGDILGGVGDILGGIGDFFGFAEGGRVPDLPKYRGDRFPARLDAGEQVLSRDLSSRLE